MFTLHPINLGFEISLRFRVVVLEGRPRFLVCCIPNSTDQLVMFVCVFVCVREREGTARLRA